MILLKEGAEDVECPPERIQAPSALHRRSPKHLLAQGSRSWAGRFFDARPVSALSAGKMEL